mmetsp:Transcript_29279/g.70666  ORF Transcript_29279/g.70666 Transcript_29279/m.70666 type:complete len:285 (+) Transcript_29279:2267-3121(+)
MDFQGGHYGLPLPSVECHVLQQEGGNVLRHGRHGNRCPHNLAFSIRSCVTLSSIESDGLPRPFDRRIRHRRRYELYEYAKITRISFHTIIAVASFSGISAMRYCIPTPYGISKRGQEEDEAGTQAVEDLAYVFRLDSQGKPVQSHDIGSIVLDCGRRRCVRRHQIVDVGHPPILVGGDASLPLSDVGTAAGFVTCPFRQHLLLLLRTIRRWSFSSRFRSHLLFGKRNEAFVVVVQADDSLSLLAFLLQYISGPFPDFPQLDFGLWFDCVLCLRRSDVTKFVFSC